MSQLATPSGQIKRILIKERIHSPGILFYWRAYTYKYNKHIFSVIHSIQNRYAYQWYKQGLLILCLHLEEYYFYHIFVMKNNLVHEIVSTHKPFREILIYPSRSLTHTPHASSVNIEYNRQVYITATDLPVPYTDQSMISAPKTTLRRFQYACHYHLWFRWKPASQFFIKFYSLMYLYIYLVEPVFDLWQGVEFVIVE